jgi:ATP-binding cassette, subfamily F, member 3
MVYNEDAGFKICEILSKLFLDRKLVTIEQRDTIAAEKLAQPLVMSEMEMGKGPSVVRDDDFLDPFTGMAKAEANYNAQYERGQLGKTSKIRPKTNDALDKKIAEFMQTKRKIPPPEVRHDKGDNFRSDIMVPGVTLIVGGKSLLENATIKLVRGKKYGLVGRNGIGKTMMINAISRGEIDKFPTDIHMLQVEQEVVGDNESVLSHILGCDVERTSLLEEIQELTNADESSMSEKEKAFRLKRMEYVSERLVDIDAEGAEAKAIEILTGIGFPHDELHKASNKFSGGWRMRIAIAKVIFSEPEILMLDEPTNHLDINALIWLENYIINLDCTIIIISHARDFLNATVHEIIHF